MSLVNQNWWFNTLLTQQFKYFPPLNKSIKCDVTIVKPPTQPHLQFIMGILGLPWAAFSGSFAARNILGVADEDYKKYYHYFSNRRYFFLPSWLGQIIGKPILFSINNGWAKFFQVDKKRKLEAVEKEF